MKANELRIGNLVIAPAYRTDGLYITEVETISKGWTTIGGKSAYSLCINHTFRETGCEWGPCIESECQPIPLTEEWLLRFGAKKINNSSDDIFELGHTEWLNNEDYFIPKPYYFADGFPDNFKLKYIHQLQNLYFALTGEELIYKP